MKPFQIVVVVIFAVLAMIAVFIFATFSGGSRTDVGTVSVWGTLPTSVMQNALDALRQSGNGYDKVSYRELSKDAFIPTLVESIASGAGPDLIILDAASLESQSDKLIPVPYRTFSKRNFQDAFIQAGETFLSANGVLGFPFYIDPYVTYWNRTLFSAGGIARAPRYWDELTDIAPRISQSTQSGTLVRSGVALGEWQNVTHAKDILVSLIVGLGNPIITTDADGKYVATLALSSASAENPAESALRFYTQFADPVQSVYSWNRSQPSARDAFLAGTLGVYFGKASEAIGLRSSNPNLNFDITAYPEVRGGLPAVPADLYALSVPRGSKNTKGALQVALTLTNAAMQEKLVSITGLPSVRRDVLSADPSNAYESIFHDAALNAYTFHDPNPTATDGIFERMVEGVSSGKFRVSEAVASGQKELEALLKVQ